MAKIILKSHILFLFLSALFFSFAAFDYYIKHINSFPGTLLICISCYIIMWAIVTVIYFTDKD